MQISTVISPLYKLIWPLHVRIRGNWAESVSTLLKTALSFVPLATWEQKWRRRFAGISSFPTRVYSSEIGQEMTKLGWKVWKKSLQSLRAELQSLRAESIAVCMQRWSFRRRSLSWQTSFRLVRNESSYSPWSFSAPSSEDLAWISNQVDPTRFFMIFHADHYCSWESRWSTKADLFLFPFSFTSTLFLVLFGRNAKGIMSWKITTGIIF